MNIDAGEALAEAVRKHHLPDFSNGKNHDAFEITFAKLWPGKGEWVAVKSTARLAGEMHVEDFNVAARAVFPEFHRVFSADMNFNPPTRVTGIRGIGKMSGVIANRHGPPVSARGVGPGAGAFPETQCHRSQ